MENTPIDSVLSFNHDALQREITNIDNTDDDYCDNEILESNEDMQENLSGEAEFDMEVPKEIKSKVTPCVIVDNENNEEKIERCNHMDNNNRSIHNLIGCFEIDSNVVREVGKEIEKLGVCLKHLNLDQNKFHRPIEGESRIKATQPFYNGTIHKKLCFLCNRYKCFYTRGDACKLHLWNVCNRNIQVPCRGLHDCPAIIEHPILASIPENTQRVRYVCTDCLVLNGAHLHVKPGSGKKSSSCVDRKKHEEDSTSSLRLIARWINNVASSNNNDTKNNLLNLLINKVIGDFNTTETKATLPSSSTVIGSSDNLLIPSFFHLNIALAVKNININEDEENSQLDSKTFKNYGEILANSIWQSRNIIKENKFPLEEPESLDEFYEAIPKNLTSFFNSLITNLYEKKHEIVKKKRKQLNLPETEMKYPLIKKITTFLTSVILKFAFPHTKIWFAQIISSLCQNPKLLPYLHSILQTVQVASHSKRHEYRVRNERISNIVPAARLEIGPNIWNLAIIDNIDIRDHTYSYGNIFDVTCNTKTLLLGLHSSISYHILLKHLLMIVSKYYQNQSFLISLLMNGLKNMMIFFLFYMKKIIEILEWKKLMNQFENT